MRGEAGCGCQAPSASEGSVDAEPAAAAAQARGSTPVRLLSAPPPRFRPSRGRLRREAELDALWRALPAANRGEADKGQVTTRLAERLRRRRAGRWQLVDALFRTHGVTVQEPEGALVEPAFAVVNIEPVDEHDRNKNGSLEEVLGDFEALGVTRLRQVGQYDLIWSQLVSESDLPYPPNEVVYDPSDPLASLLESLGGATNTKDRVLPADRSRLAGAIVTPANVARMTRLFEECHERGMRPRLMFFSPGGGFKGGDTYIEFGDMRGGGGTSPHYVESPVTVYWEEPTGGAAPTTTNSHAANGRMGPSNVLSTENGYDVEYLCEVARHMADLLYGGWWMARVRHRPLDEVIQGIELMNELQSRNLVKYSEDGTLDIASSGAAWGRFLYRIARAFQQRFAELGVECPAIYLPGNLSYGDPQTGEASGVRWSSQIVWLQAACLAAWTEANEEGVLLDEVFAGIDHHNYHCHGTTDYEAKPRPMLSLVWEVQCIREVLNGFDMPSAEVSVFESGARGGLMRLDPLSTDPVPSQAHPDFLPSLYRPEDPDSAPTFQANEVWRRLAGALLAGTAVQGWHTFIASYQGRDTEHTSPFALCGLRQDGDGVEVQGQAVQRPSWHRFARWTTLMGRWGGVQRARLLLPDVNVAAVPTNLCIVQAFTASRAGAALSLEELLACTSAAATDTDPIDEALAGKPDLIVIELAYAGGEGVNYGYVVFLDPWNNAERYCVQWEKASGTAGFTEHQVDEDGIVSITARPASRRFLRDDAPDSAYPSWPVNNTGVIEVLQTDPPRFYTSDTRVVWAVVDCPSGEDTESPDASTPGSPWGGGGMLEGGDLSGLG